MAPRRRRPRELTVPLEDPAPPREVWGTVDVGVQYKRAEPPRDADDEAGEASQATGGVDAAPDAHPGAARGRRRQARARGDDLDVTTLTADQLAQLEDDDAGEWEAVVVDRAAADPVTRAQLARVGQPGVRTRQFTREWAARFIPLLRQFMHRTDAAKLTGVPPETVRTWLRIGRLGLDPELQRFYRACMTAEAHAYAYVHRCAVNLSRQPGHAWVAYELLKLHAPTRWDPRYLTEDGEDREEHAP